MPGTAELDFASDNPYRSSAIVDEPDQGLVASEEYAELAAYVRTNREYYLHKWAARLEDPQGDVGLNWVAFFFPSLWMAYRKMYIQVVFYTAIMFLIGFTKEAVFIFVLHQKSAPVLVTMVLNVLAGLVCALYANGWYLSQARNTIASLRSHGYQDQDLLHEASRRGGTSIAAIFLVNLAIGLVLGFLVMVMLVIGVARGI